MRVGKRLFATALAAVMLCGSVATPVEAAGKNAGELYKKDGKYFYEPLEQGRYSLGGYTLEKVSHPDRGAGELDSILDPEERGQSYSWSMAEKGDYVYIGTCYNSTYYIYHNNLLTTLKDMQKDGAISKDVDVDKIASNLVEVMFGVDAFDKTKNDEWAPVIIAVNKHTGESKVVFRERDIWAEHPDIFPGYHPSMKVKNYLSGYRMAFEFHDKIYFAGMGLPTATLVEVDPVTNEAKIVYHNINKTRGVSNGVHGLLVYDDEILMCLATDNYDGKGTPGGIIVGSKDPSKGLEEWRIVADQDDFDGLPGVLHIDGLNGGGIWDIIEYNGALYVTVVTDKGNPETGEVNKQGFALYRGDKNADESFTWTQIAGNKEGSKLPFGFGIDYSMACNMWVYNNYLYFGTYNDPMLDLATVPATGNFEPLYRDLDHSIYLYRMDANGNFEMIAGKNDNKCFPEGPKGNLGAGLGNNSNQYVWRYGTHNDELYIGTYDTSTLTYMFTQLTDGQVKDMSQEDISGRAEKLEEALLILLQKQDDPVLKKFLDKTIFAGTTTKLLQQLSGLVSNLSKDWNPVDGYEKNMGNYEVIKKLVLDRIQMLSCYAENGASDPLLESADPEALQTIMTEAADETGNEDACISVADFMDSLSDEEVEELYAAVNGEVLKEEPTEEPVAEEPVAEEPVEEAVTEEKVAEEPATFALETEERKANVDYEAMKEQLKEALTKAVEELFEQMDKIYYDKNIHNFVYYFGVNYYAQKCERGFDLLVSKDGVNFDAITRNGFGDPENHGLRTIGSTEQGTFLGTANPFQGTQLWRMFSDRDLPLDTDSTATRYSVKVTVEGKGTASASQETAVEGKYVKLTATPDKGYVFDKWEVVSPSGLAIKNNEFRMPGENVEIIAHFVADDTENPGETQKPETQNPDEQKPGTQNPDEQKPGSQKPDEQKPGTQNSETGKKPVPGTGDANSLAEIYTYVALVVVAGVAIVAVMFKKFRKAR